MALGNNVIPAWMLDDKNEYYIRYTDNSIRVFYSRDKISAHQRMMSEGDHVMEWGPSKDLPKTLKDKARHSCYNLGERYKDG